MSLEPRPYLQRLSIRPGAGIDFNTYFDIAAVREIESIDFHPDVTLLVGENGSGTSTILEALALASYMDEVGHFGSYGERQLHAQSHGESFMSVITGKLRGNGLYFMDEPEAALSPNRQLAALAAIDRLVKAESEFVIATHSPILLSYPRAKILQLDGAGITEVAYEETEHYTVTRDFLNHYPRRLEQLLAEDDE